VKSGLGLALVVVAAGLVACGGASREAQSPQAGPGGGAACDAFDPLMDLYYSLTTPASFGTSSDLFYLVDLDEDLGVLQLARERLSKSAADARPLAEPLDRLADAMTKKRAELADAIGAVEKTYEAAEKTLDEAATCQHIDIRDPAGRPAGPDADKTRKANETKLASKACDPAMRLWSAVQSIDMTSDVSTSAVAAQVGELRLDRERGAIRDRLAAALKKHATALKQFHKLASSKVGETTASTQAVSDLRDGVTGSLRALGQTCLDRMRPSGRVVGGHPEPRNVTVVVRPRWSEALAMLPHDESFGSGFVVRWQEADGHVETRIVTNNHVMDGAFEADIVPGNTGAGHGPDDKDRTTATLIQANPHDDIAVLRVDPKAAGEFAQGLTFRLAPAREQEQVVAAGFPGVGIRPSFQVSKGSVSNAKFGAEAADATELSVYVQHTAPIDPGNSGGPLLDGEGNLLGMNTFKIVGRENVGLAIPTSRIQLALVRAEQTPRFDTRQAEASCNAVVAALASARPSGEAMSRFGLALYESGGQRGASADAAAYREKVQGQASNPVDAARLRAYASVRAAVEEEHGVRPFEVCFETKAGGTPGSFSAKFRTRSRTHQLSMAEEHGILRVVKFE
jgi:S1-C subfamily serine protease